jgi:hypothetical protein
MFGDIVKTEFEMDAFARWWVRLGAHAGTPRCGRPDRSRSETAAAVGAHIMELVLDAVRTERALIAADARFHRICGEILVAIFAVRSKLQRHGVSHVEARRIIANQTRDAKDESPSISDMTFAIMRAAAAWSSPSSDPARSTNVHAPRSGAASARC